VSPDLSVVVVTYQSAGFIRACLDAVAAASGERSTEVVVVDNGSTDASVALVERHHPQVRVIRNRANLGFARACNIGIEATAGEYVVLLNPDAVCTPGSLSTVVSVLERNEQAAIGAPAVRNPDGSDQRTARAFPTASAVLFGRRSPLTRWFPGNRWSRRYLSPVDRSGSSSPFQVDWVSGACLVISRRALDALGGLDDGFPMYWEDADLCRRAAARGLTTWSVPEATVVHREGSCGSRRSFRQIRWFHQGAYRFAARHELVGPKAALRPVALLALALRAALLVLWRPFGDPSAPPTFETVTT
jgi:GT2 family glycosyltransferase